MEVQRYERRATPLNERIRYFLQVMLWLVGKWQVADLDALEFEL